MLQQTYPHWELILIDDASTDGSSMLCDKIAATDARIRVMHQPHNQGVEVARYTAIQAVQGEYVMFCDSDDWISKDILEKSVEIAVREQVDAVHWQHYRVYDAKAWLRQKVTFRDTPRKLQQNEIMQELYPLFFGKSGAYVPVWSFLYRRSLFDVADITPLGQKVLEDQLTNMRLMPHMKSLYLSTEFGYYYTHGG